MKIKLKRIVIYLILAASVAMLIPGISNRIGNEAENKNVTVSILYNDIINKLSEKDAEATFDEYRQAGITTVSVMEEDLNFLVARGEITSIKYNVLCHKYDAESVRMAEYIKEKCPDVTFDSHIVIVGREDVKEKLSYMLPRKFDKDEYGDVGSFEGRDLYVMYNGRKNLWDYALGYNEKVIENLISNGFEVALIHKVKNYAKTDYLEDIEKIVKKYNVKYLNLKEDSGKYEREKKNDKNYKGIAEIINKNDMTLVVTENTDQLSNQKFFGYEYVFNKVMGEGGTKKVMRSYETYDDSQADDSNYKHRVAQYFNSTIDRNIRFITVTQITSSGITYEECAEYSIKAVKEYKEKIEKLGFTVNGDAKGIDYSAKRTFNSALCGVIMVLCLLLMIEMVSGISSFKLTLGAVILSALVFAGTFVLPASLVNLYPTAFCVFQSCFAMTVMMYFLKCNKDKLSLPVLLLGGVLMMLAVLFIGAVAMGTMLSGIEYYINNEIFRGIKLSLLIPVFYTTVVYYFMFMKNTGSEIIKDIKKVFNAEIKVYWLLIAGVIGAVGIYYIIRSGNVNKISGIEQLMRTKLTEIFPARPRTKEFLIGYPALVLFIYYMKKSDIQIIRWLLAIATSILAASVTNSFCHVFTDFTVIVTRTVNGLIIGSIVSVIAYLGNLVLIKLLKAIKERFN